MINNTKNRNELYFLKRGKSFLITHLIVTFVLNIVCEPMNLTNQFIHDSSFSVYFGMNELLFETIFTYSIYILVLNISLNIVFRLIFQTIQIQKAKQTQKLLNESTFFKVSFEINNNFNNNFGMIQQNIEIKFHSEPVSTIQTPTTTAVGVHQNSLGLNNININSIVYHRRK